LEQPMRGPIETAPRPAFPPHDPSPSRYRLV